MERLEGYIASEGGTDGKIWRYMRFDDVLECIKSSNFTLARVKKWDDATECFLDSISFRTKNGAEDLTIQSYFGEELYGSCWTLSEKSNARWDACTWRYKKLFESESLSIENHQALAKDLKQLPVCIGTSVKKLNELVEKEPLKFFGEVIYLGNDEFIQKMKKIKIVLDNILVNYPSISKNEARKLTEAYFEAMMYKRDNFEYEKEYRSIVRVDKKAKSMLGEFRQNGNLYDLHIDPSQFIEVICLHPIFGLKSRKELQKITGTTEEQAARAMLLQDIAVTLILKAFGNNGIDDGYIRRKGIIARSESLFPYFNSDNGNSCEGWSTRWVPDVE